MNRNKFDPFKKRLARDIRNSLSKSFLESLVQRDESIYQRKAADYLKMKLEEVCRDYVITRVEKYNEIFAAIKEGFTLRHSEDATNTSLGHP